MPASLSLSSPRLNLGCGHDVRPGWINLDSASLPGVDVVHDLEQLPLPFEDTSIDYVDCLDVLEHVVGFIPLVREIHRVLRPGGRVHVQSPHFTSHTSWIDPTHLRTFSVSTFDFFAAGTAFSERSYYFDFQFARLTRRRIGFRRSRYQPWNDVLSRLVNANERAQDIYEETALSRLFPARHVDIELLK